MQNRRAVMQSIEIEILLVEDSPGDIRLVREALREGKIANHLSVAGDGVEALARMRLEGRYADEARPDLVILDLNLPRKDGREVLAELRADPRLQGTLAVVMTESREEEDFLRAIELNASAYVRKPVAFAQLAAIVREVAELHFAIVTRPPRAGMATAPSLT